MKKTGHRIYNHSDIEKYWKGQLTSDEMRDMEKHALEDPLLADAMEGYAHATTAGDDLDLLRIKLDQRISGSRRKIVTMPWFRAAAAVIIIAGAGLIASQLLVKKSDDPGLATTKKQTEAGNATTDSVVVGTSTEGSQASNEQLEQREKTSTANPDQSVSSQTNATDNKVTDVAQADQMSSPPFTGEESINLPARAEVSKIDISNKFTGRIVDQQNNPVPFANIMNRKDEVGTYTNEKGLFNLISSDSVLELQVKALGYETRNLSISSDKRAEVVMNTDPSAYNYTISGKAKSKSTARKQNVQVEEPEPEVGWSNYDIYIANNIRLPDNLQERPKNSVELSFDIDNNGQPINIRVSQSSSCASCDQEAIRLLREGPKWKKKKGKKGFIVIPVQ